MSPLHPELPAAVAHAVALRGNARKRVGGLDAASYGSWYAALVDLSLRLAGLGWRNVLCETAFVVRAVEGAPREGDMDALCARWPAWHARIAHCLMDDPQPVSYPHLCRIFMAGSPSSRWTCRWPGDRFVCAWRAFGVTMRGRLAH